MNDANKELEEEKIAFQKEMTEYRVMQQEKIAANERSIADFQSRISGQKADVKEDYEKKIAELNMKNTDLKKKMADFKTDSRENWEKFRDEFGRDMDQLGTALKEFTTDNNK